MKNPVKAKLLQSEVSIGGWLNLGSPLAAEMMAAAGYEFRDGRAPGAPELAPDAVKQRIAAVLLGMGS